MSIRGIKIRLLELSDDGKKAKKFWSEELPERWEAIEEMLYYQGLPYVPKVICSELISRYHNTSLIGNFEIDKA